VLILTKEFLLVRVNTGEAISTDERVSTGGEVTTGEG